ncbi:MAG: I78 family peptidase inhibitor [Burkholderiaceae bacterium]|uniref:I78 family peptidase inhibitor n=1 Tax=Ottowia sp. TaxID=1898956 RepID=UPI0025E19A26|nr:I78 family peptidase inhibitor [Ottowia sp.]
MRTNTLAWPLALGSFLVLSACNSIGAPAPVTAAAPVPPPRDGKSLDSGRPPRNQCDAKAVQSLVGQPYGANTLAQALAAAGADTARMLRPDSMITKEYQVGRLNVVVDTAGHIVGVNCG